MSPTALAFASTDPRLAARYFPEARRPEVARPDGVPSAWSAWAVTAFGVEPWSGGAPTPLVREEAEEASSLDVALEIPGARGTTTLREIFRAFREHGVEPHPRGEEGDEDAADEILSAVTAVTTASTWGEDANVVASPLIGVTEGLYPRTAPAAPGSRPSRRRGSPGAFQEEAQAQVGTYAEMLSDIAAMGAGRVRRIKQCDVYYGALFPVNQGEAGFYQWGTEVPPPARLLSQMREASPAGGHRFARMSATSQAIILCLVLGIKLDLMPFLGMGGMWTSVSPNDLANYDSADPTYLPASTIANAVDDSEPPVEVTIEALAAAKPAWQSGMVAPSGEGWNAFYYVDALDWVNAHLDTRGGSEQTASSEESLYQKFVLNVWPTTEAGASGAPEETPTTTAYARECARRKCLGVAAFARGIGEWLAAIDAAVGSLPVARTIYDVVDTLELGNEPDGYWVTDPGTTEVAQSALEFGRYVALLAGPIHDQVPHMRFRVELHEWAVDSSGADNLQDKLSWIEAVLTEGIVAETQWWLTIQREELSALMGELVSWAPPSRESLEDVMSGGRMPSGMPWFPSATTAVVEWLATLGAAGLSEATMGFRWPPETAASRSTDLATLQAEYWALQAVDPTALIDQLGIHWYHNMNRDRGGNENADGYATSNRLVSDMTAFASLSASLLADHGFSIGWTFGEVAWPAHDPGDPALVNAGNLWGGGYYVGTSPLLQAAMYLRLLATCLAAGAESVNVYTFNYGATVATSAGYDPATCSYTFGYDSATGGYVTHWSTYSTTGVHNDVTVDTSGQPTQGIDLWKRPSWYTLRRLVWLLGRAGNGRTSGSAAGVSLAYDADDCQVICIRFAGLVDGWSRAYLVWLDQNASADTITLSFADSTGEGFELLPVVPDVIPQASGEDTANNAYYEDENGYPEPSTLTGAIPNPNWQWEGWDAAFDPSSAAFSSGFNVVLRKTDPDGSATGAVVIAPLCILTNATFQLSS